jgi:hypothetical protein
MCGTEYQNYREYFNCWTGHLDQKLQAVSSQIAPIDHKDAVEFYKENPGSIERGLRIIASEVGVFHGRIDLIGIDNKNRLVLIDVDNGHDPQRKSKQLHHYKTSILWMGSKVFGIRHEDLPETRLLMVCPNKFVKDV